MKTWLKTTCYKLYSGQWKLPLSTLWDSHGKEQQYTEIEYERNRIYWLFRLSEAELHPQVSLLSTQETERAIEI